MKVSLSEVLLATRLAKLRIDFRQQVPIGPYTVDFLLKPNIVVECEGLVHSSRQERDQTRTFWLEVHGYRVWRIPNYTVFADPISIAKMLRDAQRDEDENYSFGLMSEQ